MEDIIYIRVLLIKDHMGKISPEEKSELDKYLEESEKARELQNEIKAIPKESFVDFTNNINVNDGLNKILEQHAVAKLRKRKVITRAISAMSAAALIAWGFFGLTSIYNRNTSNSDLFKNNNAINGNSATLVLANGNVINLNDSGYQNLMAGSTSLRNNNRVIKLGQGSGKRDDGTIGWNTLIVPAKLDYQVELTDGTRVWLNSTTKFRFPFAFSGGNREVYLDAGEAYFQVSPNSDQPFLVHSGMAEIQVLGTDFNINAYNTTRVVTSLTSGKVAIKAGIDRKELAPGSEAIVEAGKAISTQSFDPSITLSWRQGLHYFNDATINSVAVMLERWFDTPLIIDNPQIANIPFRGRLYRKRPLQHFIDQMNLTGDVTFYWKEGKLHCK